MTSEEFRKTNFNANTMIEYDHPGAATITLCFLCEVDFEEEILTVCDIENPRQLDNRVQVNIKYCRVYRKNVINLKPFKKEVKSEE